MVKIPVDLRYFLKLQRKDIATPADVQQMSFVLRITFLDIFFKGFICLLLPPHWSSLVQIWPLSVLLCFRGFSPDILPVQKHAYFVVNLNFPSSMSFTRMFSEEAGQAVNWSPSVPTGCWLRLIKVTYHAMPFNLQQNSKHTQHLFASTCSFLHHLHIVDLIDLDLIGLWNFGMRPARSQAASRTSQRLVCVVGRTTLVRTYSGVRQKVQWDAVS